MLKKGLQFEDKLSPPLCDPHKLVPSVGLSCPVSLFENVNSIHLARLGDTEMLYLKSSARVLKIEDAQRW